MLSSTQLDKILHVIRDPLAKAELFFEKDHREKQMLEKMWCQREGVRNSELYQSVGHFECEPKGSLGSRVTRMLLLGLQRKVST
jgi:hypothetical protein